MSRDWVNQAQTVLIRQKNIAETLPMLVVHIIKDETWRDKKDSQNELFTSFRALVEHRLPQGLEIEWETLENFCKHHAEATRLLRAVVPAAKGQGEHSGNQHTERKVANSHIPTHKQSSTSEARTLARLKRDRPDLAEQVVSGDKSANAAAIEAGFRTKKYQVEATPESVSRMLTKHLPGWQLVNRETGEVA